MCEAGGDPASRPTHPGLGPGPVLLALVGDSGSGKATLARGVTRLLGAEQVTDLWLDDYHRYDRAERHWRAITALHPDCNRLDLMREHLEALRRGEEIEKPVYDHRTGTFAPAERLRPRRFVLAHGLLALHDDALARCFDVSVFVDPEPALRLRWKLDRDISRRGYSEQQVREQLEHRRADAERWVRPQRDRADVVIELAPAPDGGDDVRAIVRVRARQHAPWLRDALGIPPDRPELVVHLTPDYGAPDAAALESWTATQLAARHPELLERLGEVGRYEAHGATARSSTIALAQLVLAVLGREAAAAADAALMPS